MRLFRKPFIILLCLLSSTTIAEVNERFEKIKNDPNALYVFFKEMPKGGELHYHYTGSVYAETMLDAAANSSYCVDPTTLEFNKNNGACYGVTSKQITSTFYDKIVRAWSMKDFTPGRESGHDHFFNSFQKFVIICKDFKEKLLANIIQRAALEHELYMEIQMFDLKEDDKYAKLIQTSKTLEEKQKILLNNEEFKTHIQQFIDNAKQTLTDARKNLQCDTNPKQPACLLNVKFQFFVKRSHPLDNVFAQALAGFEVASKSKEIIGINLVEAEDGMVSLRDYDAQMQIFEFLHQKYPNVHISLHAGELSQNLVANKDLNFHIRHAIFKGHAERIGHGVDIAYENNNKKLLQYMANTPIPVEINLTSNKSILNIFGKNHPINFYLNNNVPIVLSTDDEGILRTDLTTQYVNAVIEHHLNYPTIKMINRNALTYSFLPGKSLWANPLTQDIIPECKDLDSMSCHKFIDGSEKAKIQWDLEKKLLTFEKQ